MDEKRLRMYKAMSAYKFAISWQTTMQGQDMSLRKEVNDVLDKIRSSIDKQ